MVTFQHLPDIWCDSSPNKGLPGFKYYCMEETNSCLFLLIDLCSCEDLPLRLKGILKQDLDYYYFLPGTCRQLI